MYNTSRNSVWSYLKLNWFLHFYFFFLTLWFTLHNMISVAESTFSTYQQQLITLPLPKRVFLVAVSYSTMGMQCPMPKSEKKKMYYLAVKSFTFLQQQQIHTSLSCILCSRTQFQRNGVWEVMYLFCHPLYSRQ